MFQQRRRTRRSVFGNKLLKRDDPFRAERKCLETHMKYIDVFPFGGLPFRTWPVEETTLSYNEV